jgi:hypothetical protein
MRTQSIQMDMDIVLRVCNPITLATPKLLHMNTLLTGVSLIQQWSSME